tara:strand:- start:2182 stop:2556 length:375 start_codon:yes stop_codon:yes gene_type:complete
MPSNHPTWNVSKAVGSNILIDIIRGIVSNQIDMTISMSNISASLKTYTSHKIRRRGKETDAFSYLSVVFGGVENFVDKFEGIFVFIKDGTKYIKILDEETVLTEYPFNSYCGWELVNVPDVKVL